MKKRMKKLCSLFCALALVAGLLPAPALAADPHPNLLINGKFDDETGWTFSQDGNAGVNPAKKFWLGDGGSITQTVTIPDTKTYTIKGTMSTSDNSANDDTMIAKFGIRYKDGAVIQEKTLTYGLVDEEISLGNHELEVGDRVEVYMTQTGNHAWNWVNGDNVYLYDSSYVPPVEIPDYSGNLLKDPGFEDESKAWTFGNDTGWGYNNAHRGRVHYSTWGAVSLWQTVEVPYTGIYHNSSYNVAGGAGGTYGVRMQDSGETLDKITLPARFVYGEPDTLAPVELIQGDVIEVYIKGIPGNWVNGDDFFLGYDFTALDYNLLTGADVSEDLAVRLPWACGYDFSAEVAATEEAVVTVGGESVTVGAGETQTVTIAVATQETDAMLEISVTGDCTVSNATLTANVSEVENTPPTATGVKATVEIPLTGRRIDGSYIFTDEDDGFPSWEGATTFRWLVADTEDGTYTAIENAAGKSLVVPAELDGKYVKFEVTPVDLLGESGAPVRSDAIGPFRRNYVDNYSLDLQANNNPIGWAAKNGGALGNNKSKARTDLRYVDLPGTSSDAEAYYTLTPPQNAHYSVGGWVNTAAVGGSLGVRTKTGVVLGSVSLPDTEKEYAFVELEKVALEGGVPVEVFIKNDENSEGVWADDFQMLYLDDENVPAFTNLHAFSVKEAIETTLDAGNNAIEFVVPYGTDVTALTVTATVSEGASITPASGAKVNFTDPVTFTITNGEATATWTVTCVVDEQRIAIKSDNETLQDGFTWAARKLNQFVMTGIKNGPINVPQASGETADYIPSYWCGYYDRTAYYSRDFVHQAVGGQIAGLWKENRSMFQTFADFAAESRKWYTGWAFNFDGSIYTMDYKSDTNFVREVPAQFELVEKAYKQYLWSGDETYITDPAMWNFYTKTMTDFVTLHDGNQNGIAEGTGGGIFQGSCTYNEMPGESAIEAGDAIGSQYQATLAYAAMLKERARLVEKGIITDDDTDYAAQSEEWYAKAAELKRYFNEEWSVKDPENPNGQYVRTLGVDNTKYDGFGYENSWFIPMKLVTEPGPRNDAYLDYIREQMSGELSDHEAAHHNNVEAWSYLPDTFFPYNRADDAWHYMEYILSVKDLPHQRPIQGSNGDYPEISFTIISQTIEGMMGMEADAANHKIVTAPRLPSDVGYVEASYIQVGDRANGGHTLDLTHQGLKKSVLTNDSDNALSWEARFYGDYPTVLVDGKAVSAEHKDVNGVKVSYAIMNVPAGSTVTAEAYTPTFSGGSTTKPPVVTENPDGSKTTTVTDKKTGAITETTQWPDGKQVEKVTTKNGDKTLTVTDRDGSKSVVLRLPAVIPAPETPFTDIPADHWAESAANRLAGLGLMTGTRPGVFDGGAPVTRGTLATILHRLSGGVELGENPFADVKDGAWYSDAIAWAAKAGVVSGNGSGFDPDGSITRESLAVMLCNYVKLLGVDTKADGMAVSEFTDSGSVSTWARDAVSWAVKAGILQGSNDMLNPGGTASRAEVAVMLSRFVDYIK